MPTPFPSSSPPPVPWPTLPAGWSKIDHLAALLTQVAPDEVPVAIAYLSGAMPQGRLGIGGAAIREARDVPPAGAATLTLGEVDAAFTELAVGGWAGQRPTPRRAAPPPVEPRDRSRAGLPRAAALRRAAPGRARGRARRRRRARGGRAGRPRPARGDARGRPGAGRAHAALAGGEPALGALRPAASCSRCSRCSPIPPTTSTRRCRRLGDAALEYKLDGARIQVHKAGDEIVRLLARAARRDTGRARGRRGRARAARPRSLILDGEVIALEPDGTPHPFQDTMRRFGRTARRRGAARRAAALAVLLRRAARRRRRPARRPQRERFAALTRVAPDAAGHPAPSCRRAPTRPPAFLDRALAQGHEGVMAKARDSAYAAGSRGASWLKVKSVRTLDLVVLAVEWGSGRRQGWLSNLHLGARDPVGGGFVMLGKTFKGLTDAMLAWQTAGAARARSRPRRLRRARAAGAGRRDRVQRHAGEPALPRRHGAALCAGEAVPPRQARRRGRHDRRRCARILPRSSGR